VFNKRVHLLVKRILMFSILILVSRKKK